MRSFSVIIFALTVAAGLAAPSDITDVKVGNLIDAYIAFSEAGYQKIDPIKLRDVPILPIVSIIPPVGIVLSAVNRTVSGFSKNIVQNEGIGNSSAKFRITYPDIKMQSNYSVGGLVYGKRVWGSGLATLNLSNVTYDVSVTLRNENVRWPQKNASYLQISELKQTVSVGGVATNLTGLNADGLTQEEVTKFLDSEATTILKWNIPIWERLADQNGKSQLNLALVGHSIDDAIDWLQKNTPVASMITKIIPEVFISV